MISQLLGFDSDYIIIGLAAVTILLFILYIVNIVQMSKLKKNYRIFMEGKDAKSLEETLVKRLDQVDELITANKTNQRNIQQLFNNMKFTFQKVGLVKYDAFNEMGGKLSFALAMLDKENNGFVMNAIHSSDGCYTYVKEIVKGESYVVLGEEEKEALRQAVNSHNELEQ